MLAFSVFFFLVFCVSFDVDELLKWHKIIKFHENSRFNCATKVAGEKFIQKPTIVSKTESYGNEGGQLELTCTVEAELGVQLIMDWVTPNDNIAKTVWK